MKACSECKKYDRRKKLCKGTSTYVAGWGKVCDDFEEAE